MKISRMVRAAVAAVILLTTAGIFVSCKVDKAALARQVGLQELDLRSVPDGVYESAYTIQPPAGVMAANRHVRVRVTVSGSRCQKIELLDPPGLRSSETFQALAARLVDSQRLSVDAISSSTITSMAVLKAVQGAVEPTGK